VTIFAAVIYSAQDVDDLLALEKAAEFWRRNKNQVRLSQMVC
jgi:hypothetical protein